MTRTHPIVFGIDVEIFCSLPKNFSSNKIQQWKSGSNVLIHNENSKKYKDKYEGFLEGDSFSLKIKNWILMISGRIIRVYMDLRKYTANLTTANYQCR